MQQDNVFTLHMGFSFLLTFTPIVSPLGEEQVTESREVKSQLFISKRIFSKFQWRQ